VFLRPAIALLLAVVAACAAAPAGASAAGPCTRVASPTGHDTAAGTADAPFRTAQHLVDTLRAGDTGCLRTGTYSEQRSGPFVMNFVNPGRPGARITVRSFPGETARIQGAISVARMADYVTLTGLSIDGRLKPLRSIKPIAIQLMGSHAVIADNVITSPDSSCVTLGYTGSGYAIGTMIRNNLFHDCGSRRHGLHDHAIYANNARGGRIVDNLFVRSAAWAVHFYGFNKNIRVIHNVMYDNAGGVIFSGYGARLSSRNRVERNVIVGSTERPGIQSWWGGRRGRGNRAQSNCLADNAGSAVDLSGGGFTAAANVEVAEPFADLASGDLRLDPGPCLRAVGYDTVSRLTDVLSDTVAQLAITARN
jgi:hypothetical protein